MPKPLAIGDRVAVYQDHETRHVGKVVGVTEDGNAKVAVQLDANPKTRFTFHRKQCRRLNRRTGRRVWWREMPDLSEAVMDNDVRFSPPGENEAGWIEFREVRPRAPKQDAPTVPSEPPKKRRAQGGR